MKKQLCVVCALLAAFALAGCELSFSGSRVGSENQLTMKYTSFNTTDEQLLKLEAGDVLDVAVVNDSGKLSVTVQKEQDDPVYETEEAETGTFQIQITDGGTYQVTVTGEHAKGSFRISKATDEE